MSHMFPVRNGLKQEDALSPLLFNSAVEYAIKSFHVNQGGVKLNGTHQLLVYADDHMVGHPRCVFINYIWLNHLSNTTNLWWIDVYYLVINYMFRRLWPSSG